MTATTRRKPDTTSFRPGDRVEVYFKSDWRPCTDDNRAGAGEVVYQRGGYTCVRFDGETTQHEWPAGWCWLA